MQGDAHRWAVKSPMCDRWTERHFRFHGRTLAYCFPMFDICRRFLDKIAAKSRFCGDFVLWRWRRAVKRRQGSAEWRQRLECAQGSQHRYPWAKRKQRGAEGMKWRHKMSGGIVSARRDVGVAGQSTIEHRACVTSGSGWGRRTNPIPVQRAGCVPEPAVSRPPWTAGGALSMTQRSAVRNGNDRSSRLCGVSARPVSLTRHSPADKSVIRSGRRRSGTAHRHRGLGWAFFRRKWSMVSGILAIFAPSTLNLLYSYYIFYMKAPRCENGMLFLCS